MIFGAIRTLAGLMDAPSPTGTHSEDVIHQEKNKKTSLFFLIHQKAMFSNVTQVFSSFFFFSRLEHFSTTDIFYNLL